MAEELLEPWDNQPRGYDPPGMPVMEEIPNNHRLDV